MLAVGMSLCFPDFLYAQAALPPSFRCAPPLTQTEHTICRDPELAAYDRAMAWANRRGWRSGQSTRTGQRGWLSRRDACGGRRDCILASYREWIDELDWPDFREPSLERLDKGEDWRSLYVRSLGEGWFLFSVTAIHIYDPRDGRGKNMSDAGATGVVHLTDGRGVWFRDPAASISCGMGMTRLSARRWRLIEISRWCGGVGATVSGDYRRK